MSKWKKIGIGAAAAIVVLLIVIATRPDTYRVERSATISASPDVVYAQVADFHKWGAWAPWFKLDPNIKLTYGGTQGTVGASYAWTGNDEVGQGEMIVLAVDQNKRLDFNLHFIKPFDSAAKNGFVFEGTGKETKVTWSMEGTNNFMSKAMCLVMDMDKMIGKDFEKGLAQLKQIAEAAPAPAAAN